uniref:Uncharacterized protein n=1 Tax=Rhizophora mucronata TaxID=61149 RepID=A0A2P2KUI0_RHIMU
MYVVKNRKI